MSAERPKALLHRFAMAASRGETDREAEREILDRIEAGDQSTTAQADIAALQAKLAEAERDRDLAVKDRRDLTKALTNLTCGGSEFFIRRGEDFMADIPACVSRINEIRNGAIAARISAMRAEKQAVDRAAQAEAKLAEAVDVLRRIEWCAGVYGGECLDCGEDQEDGHNFDCALGKVLAASTTGGTGEAMTEMNAARDEGVRANG